MTCKYCGADIAPPYKSCQELYNQVAFYTLNHPDPDYFIHQLVVDAYAAQHANENSKPITLAFALIGLYLVVERGYTGKQAQLAHMQLAKEKREYPLFVVPKNRGKLTAAGVLKIKEGKDRDQMIESWANETWKAFSENRNLIVKLLIETKFKDIK